MTVPSLSMGRVALTVHEIEAVGAWYEKAVGLALLSRDGETARYGVGDEVLLELRRDKAARRRGPQEAGLFHSAFLLPERADLGQWVLQASAKRLPVSGVADHLVSEAVYLNDPEGNGVEIYTDRPRDQWRWTGGKVAMSSDPLDVEGLVESAKARGPWTGAPLGTVMGHVHLQVGKLPEAQAFYRDLMGLDLTCDYPGASFYAADGYHHHIATNIWNSRNAPKRALPSTGLSEVEVRLSAERAAAIKSRAAAAGIDLGQGGGSRLTLQDPWNTPIALVING